MKEFKGTPGPWERGGGKNGGGDLFVYCNNSLGSAVCDATSHYSVFDKNTRIANLNLIAAAPELLEALQQVKNEVGHFLKHQCPELMSEIDYAINKALGVE